jgi:hypothetical protein
MKRRTFVTFVAFALAAPLARAQQSGKVYRIGFLGIASPTPQVLSRDKNFLPFRRFTKQASGAGSGRVGSAWVPQSVVPAASRGSRKGRYGK